MMTYVTSDNFNVIILAISMQALMIIISNSLIGIIINSRIDKLKSQIEEFKRSLVVSKPTVTKTKITKKR